MEICKISSAKIHNLGLFHITSHTPLALLKLTACNVDEYKTLLFLSPWVHITSSLRL